MTQEPVDPSKTDRVTNSEILATEARLGAAGQALVPLQSDPSASPTVVALKKTADALYWVGRVQESLSPDALDTVPLLRVMSEQLRRLWINLSIDLQSALQHVGNVNNLAVRTAAEELLNGTARLLQEVSEQKDLGPGFRKPVEDKYVETLTALNQYTMWLRNDRALEKIEEAADSQAEAAGEQSEQSLSAEFDALAKKEGRAANVFRGLTIFLFLVVIGFAAAVAFEAREPSVEVAQRLAVGIPVLLLAGYFSKEAGHHRNTARWASVLGVQLRSVRAYTVSMMPTEASTLRVELGKRAFLETPETKPQSEAAEAASSVEPALVREVTELLRASQKR